MTSDEWVTLPVTLAELDAIIDRTRAEERALAVEVQEKAVKDAEERGHLQARLEGMLLGRRSVLDRLNNPDEALHRAVSNASGRFTPESTARICRALADALEASPTRTETE